MANEKRLIDLLRVDLSEVDISDCTDVDDIISAVITYLFEQPTVDAVEVPDKKLLRAIKLLIKQYEHSKNSDYVHSPVAHALYHTWKQVEERRTDNA